MALNPQEQFQVLLRQLQYEEVPNIFQDASLTKLTIHKQSRIWQFHLSLPELPDVSTLAMLIGKLQTTFANIATVNYEISLANHVSLCRFRALNFNTQINVITIRDIFL